MNQKRAQNTPMNNSTFSRDAAGSFSIPATKPGAIKIMCSMPDQLEIYTPHETFKFQTPESIDPDRTNPNAMWVNAKTHDIGCASPFVARTFIMANEVLHIISQLEQSERDQLLLRMHTIKEALIQCVIAKQSYQDALTSEIAFMESNDFKLTPNSRAFERFPVVVNIEAKITAFLIPARKVITEVCQIPTHFWKESKASKPHSALDHLVEKDLLPILGAEHRLVTYLKGFYRGTKRIIDLRNGHEHASTTKASKLNVKNFEMMATNQIRSPVWFLDGEEPEDISAHMHAIPEFLLDLAESTFVGCVDATLPKWPPMGFQVIDEVDPECPIRFRLTIDPNRMQGRRMR